jgi:putative tryptophan/tyrosine transport system substrate-binding protein
MQRREFIAAIGSAAASSAIWPEAGSAQSLERVRRIGILVGSIESTEAAQALLGPFRDSLSTRGWAEGRNLRIDLRVSGDDAGRVRADARELASLAPDLIVAISGDATRALQQQTHVIPIVFIGAVDVDETVSIVKKTRRPEGNITGITSAYDSSGDGKCLQLLKEAAPQVKRVGVIQNSTPGVTSSGVQAMAQWAADVLGVKVILMPYRDAVDIARTIDAFAAQPNGGLFVNPVTAANRANRETINRLSVEHRLPTIYTTRLYAAEGGLMSYGSDFADLFRRAAFYVDRILRGAKVNELPFEFSTSFKLVVNLKTAKAIGLPIPESILVRANEVLE